MPAIDAERGWRFRPDVEGLRAVAIAGVVLFHAGVAAVPGGFLGVDVFFVLSGFLITGVLLKEVQSTGRISLPKFWSRRIRRLLPAATLVSLATLALVASLDSPFGIQSYAKSAIAFATYWSNLLFVRRGADYFDHSVLSDPFLHTWSLAVEEQYYLVFAPLCVALLLLFRGGTADAFRRRLWFTSALVSALSFIAGLYLTAHYPLVSFYGLPSRAWEFGLGGLLALAPGSHRAAAAPRDSLQGAAGMAMILAGFGFGGATAPHPGWITLLPVAGTALVIDAGGRSGAWIARVLDVGILRWLGRLSYSWYLWHWPLTVYWAELGGSRGIPLLLGMPVLSLALAQGTYLVLEAPARRAPWLQPSRRSIAAAGVLALAVVMAGLLITRIARDRLAEPSAQPILEARHSSYRLSKDDCHLTIDEVEPKPCAYGDTASSRVLVVFGDSHAEQWFEALEPASAARGLRVLPRTKSGCPSASVTVRLPATGRPYAACDRWRENVFRELDSLKPAIVVLASYQWYHRAEGALVPGGAPSPFPPGEWREALARTVARIPEGTRVLLIEDSPRAGFDVPDCLFKHVGRPELCAFPKATAFVPGVRSIGPALAARRPGTGYIDLSDRICPAESCPVVEGEVVIYLDMNHLSTRFVRSLAPLLGEVLDRLGPH